MATMTPEQLQQALNNIAKAPVGQAPISTGVYPTATPPADPVQAPVPITAAQQRVQSLSEWALPGSRQDNEIQDLSAQQGVLASATDGLQMTTAAGWVRTSTEEAPGIADEIRATGLTHPLFTALAIPLSLVGMRAAGTDYDKQAEYSRLTADIPYEYHDEILQNDGIESALRSRARVLDDLARGQRLTRQSTGSLAVIAGSLFDIDLPLAMFSGGAYASAKVARTALRAAARLRLPARLATRVASTATGINAGAQGGFLVSGMDAVNRETVGWQDVANATFQSALLGGAIGSVLNADKAIAIRAARDEFHARIARDDPSLNTSIDADAMTDSADFMDPAYFQEPGESSVGAVYLGVPNVLGPQLVDPNGQLTPRSQSWIDFARSWRHDTDWQTAKDAVADEWWARVATSRVGSFTVNTVMSLYKSQSSVANYISSTIFESPTGITRGRATAAARMENYNNRIQSHLAHVPEQSLLAYARERGGTWVNSGFGYTQQARAAFNREVMLEMNQRALGRGLNPNQHVSRAADAYESAGNEALGIGRGRLGETPVDGFDNIKDRRGYTPYHWSGANLLALEKAGVVTRANVVSAMADAYRRAGMFAGKDADKVAKAVILRSVSRESDIDTSVVSMLSGDGREWLEATLTSSGVTGADLDALMQRLDGAAGERGKEGFAKMRNEIDMSTTIRTEDGSELRVVDLLDNDMHKAWQRYSRRMSGTAGLARQGITNRAQRTELIAAMQAEQRALGEEAIDGDMMAAMLSHFDGGPVHGFSAGHTNEGIGPELAGLKRIAGFALYNRLGLTQLGETGATIAQIGLGNWVMRGPMRIFDQQMKAASKTLLDDMAHVTGRIGEEHIHLAPHLDLDSVSNKDRGEWMRKASQFTSNIAWLQGYTSLFNHVRSFQQTTAALGIADKVLREVKAAMDEGRPINPTMMARFEGDLGLDATDITAYENLITAGTIEFTTIRGRTFVNRLNMDQWDTETKEVFGASVTRNVNQIVQKAMAGEQDAWMHTQWGSIITHLKTFPMAAFQKQAVRNARYMDMQSLGTLFYGMGTAAMIVMVKDALDGKERSTAEVAKTAFSYSNMTGFIPLVSDPVMTILGLEDARFNSYGPYTTLVPPVFTVADNMRRVPGALWDTATGTADYYDEQALKALPFARTIGISRMFE